MIIKGTDATTGRKVYQYYDVKIDFGCDLRYKPLGDYMIGNKVNWHKLVDEKDALDAIMKGVRYAEGLLANPFENKAFMRIAVNTEHDQNRVYRKLEEFFAETIIACNEDECADGEDSTALWRDAYTIAESDFDKLLELVKEWLGR